MTRKGENEHLWKGKFFLKNPLKHFPFTGFIGNNTT